MKWQTIPLAFAKFLRILAITWACGWIIAGVASELGSMVTRVGNPPRDLFGRALQPAPGAEIWVYRLAIGSSEHMQVADRFWRNFWWLAFATGIGGASWVWGGASRMEQRTRKMAIEDLMLRPSGPQVVK